MSRPRKVILLCCSDEQRRSELSFILDTRIYRVIGCISAYPPMPDCALVVDGPDAKAMTSAITLVLPELVIVRMNKTSDMIDVLENIKAALVKKRGPKPASPADLLVRYRADGVSA